MTFSRWCPLRWRQMNILIVDLLSLNDLSLGMEYLEITRLVLQTLEALNQNRSSPSPCVSQEATEWGGPLDKARQT
jgi:hypothetical protein